MQSVIIKQHAHSIILLASAQHNRNDKPCYRKETCAFCLCFFCSRPDQHIIPQKIWNDVYNQNLFLDDLDKFSRHNHKSTNLTLQLVL